MDLCTVINLYMTRRPYMANPAGEGVVPHSFEHKLSLKSRLLQVQRGGLFNNAVKLADPYWAVNLSATQATPEGYDPGLPTAQASLVGLQPFRVPFGLGGLPGGLASQVLVLMPCGRPPSSLTLLQRGRRGSVCISRFVFVKLFMSPPPFLTPPLQASPRLRQG